MASSLALLAAFWVAVVTHARRAPRTRDAGRFVVGLGVGAARARLGWVALYADRVEHVSAVLDPSLGFSILFVPLGPLLLAPWAPSRRGPYLAAAFGALPLAFATARLGCLVAGCCHGVETTLAWGLPGGERTLHPVQVYELGGWLVVYAATRGVPERWVAPLVLAGFGAMRLLLEPLRAPPPLGMPLLSVEWIATAWLLAGALLALSQRNSRPSNAPESRQASMYWKKATGPSG